MGRWALFSTLLVAALPSGLVGYQLFVFITNYSGNARTLHQVIAYGAGACALALIGLTVASPALVPAAAGGARPKGGNKNQDDANPADAESFAGGEEFAEDEVFEDVGSGEIEDAGSGEFEEVEEVDAVEDLDLFEDVEEDDDDGKKKRKK
jgi:hypothetical protein